MTAPRRQLRTSALAWPVLAAVVALVYAPVWRAGFIWNDSDYLTAPTLRSFAGLVRIWTELGATEQYYPVLHSWFWVQQWIFGDAPAGYHVVNVALHALSAGLFALLLRRLAVPGAWLAAGLFALHPVAVESVAWISEQKNTLSLAFYLGAALAWLRFEERRAPRDYVLASALFVLALLSKSVTATLPAALLVVAWWRRGRVEWARDVRPLVPWVVAGAAFGLFTAWVEHRVVGARGADFELGGLGRVLLAARVSWFYLGKLVWPVELIFIYPRWTVNAAIGWQWLFPVALLGLLALAWRARTWSRAPLAALLFFLGSLFPTMGFFNVYAFQFSFVADHWQYLPMLGPIALAAGGFAGWAAQQSRTVQRFAFVGVALVGIACGARTWMQSGLYRDIETFYRQTLAANPESWMGHNNLGLLLLEDGRAEEALTHLRAAAQLKPTHAEVANNYGAALRATGHGAEALAQFRRAATLKPDYVEAEFNLALALAESGATAEAEEHYRRVLALRPAHAKAANNLGNLRLASHDAAGAIELFRAAIRADPDSADAHHNLGVAFFTLRRGAEAVPELRRALELDPARDVSRWLLAIILAADRPAEAVPLLEELIRRQPRNADAHQLFAQCLWQLGRREEAAQAAATAQRLRRG